MLTFVNHYLMSVECTLGKDVKTEGYSEGCGIRIEEVANVSNPLA